MNKNLLIAALLIAGTQAKGQNTRALTPAEVSRNSSVCELLKGTIPQQFEGYNATLRDCNVLDFAEEKDGKYYTGTDAKGRLLNSNYYFIANFKLANEDESEEMAITNSIVEEVSKGKAADKNKLAVDYGKSYRINSRKGISITVNGNWMATRNVTYHKAIKPQKITIPVPASYAMMYAMGEKSPIDDNNTGVTQSIAEYKGDLAIIVLGTKPASVKLDWDGKDDNKVETITYHDVTPIDKTPEGLGIPPKEIQNIEILISGDKAIIEKIISRIDWKKLQSCLGK